MSGITDWIYCTSCRITTLHRDEDGAWRCTECGQPLEEDDDEGRGE